MTARRLLPVLLLLGMSIFLFNRAGQADVGYTVADVHLVEGTVATSETSVRSIGTPTRPSTAVVEVVTLAGWPQNLAFGLTMTPAGGITPAARVRLEILDDPQEQHSRAQRFADGEFEVRAVGATVDGQVVYSAAAEVERAESAGSRYRLGALACLVLGLAWAGVVIRRVLR